MGWLARFSPPETSVVLLRAQLLLYIIDLLEEQTDPAIIAATFQGLQWLLAAGNKKLWIADDDDSEPLYSGELIGLVVKRMTAEGEIEEDAETQVGG